MSVRVEFMSASSIGVSYDNELELAEDLPIDYPEDRMVLCLGADEVSAITGDPAELLGLIGRMYQAVVGSTDHRVEAERLLRLANSSPEGAEAFARLAQVHATLALGHTDQEGRNGDERQQ